MQPWQTDIYFIAGESTEAVKKSPFLEVASRKGVQVLYLTDPIDEYLAQHLSEFEGHKLLSLSKEGVKFGDEDESLVKRRAKAYKDKFDPLTSYLKGLFASKVGKVTVSDRVDKSPAVIVTSQWGYTANMERLMRAQTMGSQDPRAMSPPASKSMELNPRHPIVTRLGELVVTAPDAQATKDLAHLLFDTAMIASGFVQDEVDAFTERMYRLIASELDVTSMDLEPEIEVPPEEKEDASDEGDDEDFESSGSDEL
jgi:heat shock protein beta